jgi:hypothetical protein
MMRKACAGHVTGGRVFGYENVEVLGSSGAPWHVDLRIVDTEAAVVRRIIVLGRGRKRPARDCRRAQRSTRNKV